jgi:transposase
MPAFNSQCFQILEEEVHNDTGVVLGRKNYLFCGSGAGGQRAACVYTIVETAKMCGINPQAYLADVLGRIADHLIQKIDALLPWLWTQ